MESFLFALKMLCVVFIYIVIIGLFMKLADYTGEKLGFKKIIIKLLKRKENKL